VGAALRSLRFPTQEFQWRPDEGLPNAQPPWIPLIDVKLGMRGAGASVDTGFAIGADRGLLKPQQC
jgi:hypothetical protein